MLEEEGGGGEEEEEEEEEDQEEEEGEKRRRGGVEREINPTYKQTGHCRFNSTHCELPGLQSRRYTQTGQTNTDFLLYTFENVER